MILVSKNKLCALNSDEIFYYGKNNKHFKLMPDAYQIIAGTACQSGDEEYVVLGEYDIESERDAAFDNLIDALGKNTNGIYKIE